jgi:hydrogenase nickel incorporation protein HypB
MEITIMKNILDRNQDMAEQVRSIMRDKNIFLVNLISSPGAGKTTLLERTCEELGTKFRIGVIEGDITTDLDGQRLKKYNIPIVVINTEGGCHLDSHSISKALATFDLEALDIIFVENVGNLICPSHFDLGETCKVAMVSTTEGDDKVIKYPLLFREARVIILNKTDLIPYTNFNMEKFLTDVDRINPQVPLIKASCTRNEGLEEWVQWIIENKQIKSSL